MARDDTVSARVSTTERLRIELAAGVEGQTRSRFVREAADEKAAKILDSLRGQDRQRDGNVER